MYIKKIKHVNNKFYMETSHSSSAGYS